MIAVETGIVGKNGINTMGGEPAAQIRNGLCPGAEDGGHRCFQEQGAFEHAADLTLYGKNMVFGVVQLKCFRVGDHSSDGHDLICPVSFGVDYSKSAHVVPPFFSCWEYYIENGWERQGCFRKKRAAILDLHQHTLSVTMIAYVMAWNGEYVRAFVAAGSLPAVCLFEGDCMSLINVTNLTFAYDGSYDTIFENVSFQLDTNWRLGFTGRNGRGKTTFLNLLLGKYEFQGSISASVSFSYFPYSVADTSVLAIDAVEEMYPEYEYWRIAREMAKLQLEEEVLYRPYETLSNGEQTKLQLAVLFSKENHFLLIDEPTNHLDIRGRELVSRYLNSKKGFILVSHDRAFLDGCVDYILSINKTDIQICKGNFSTWWENKSRRDAFEQAENEKLKKESSRLEETAREKAGWSDRAESGKIGQHVFDRGYVGHKAEKMMARSKAIEKRQSAAIEEKSKLLKNVENSDELKIFQTPFHTKRLAELKDVTIDYGDGAVCEKISFSIHMGDRIALQGANGSGKSSLIKLLCGVEIPYTGDLWRGNGLQISYVSQDTSALKGKLSDLARNSGIDESLFLAMLAKLDVPKSQMEKDMSSLSAGQKKKVLLAKSICEPMHLHIWDEPMNYIDVISRMQIESLLRKYQPTILFVEHDKTFCENVATKTVHL